MCCGVNGPCLSQNKQDKVVDTDFDGYRYRDPTPSELLQIRKNRLETRKIELEQELVTINAQLHNIGKL